MGKKGAESHTTVNVNVPTTTETVVVTVDGISLPGPGKRVRVTGSAQLTAGTGATAVTPRIRRGTLATDPLVGEGNALTIAAGNTDTVDLEVVDTPGELASGAYVLTVQQTAATGAGTVLQVSLAAEWDQ